MDPELSRPNQLSPNSLTNLRLKKVLKSYQQCAPDSLSGPNYYNPTWINGDHGLKFSGDKYTSNNIVATPYSTSSSHNIKANSNNTNNNNISKSNNNYLANINTNSNSSNNNANTNKHNNNNSSNNKNHNTSPESQVSSVNSQHLSCSSSLGSTNGLSHSNGPSLISSGEGGGGRNSNSSNNINISTGGREKASRGSGESPTPVTKSSNLPVSSSSSCSLSSTSSLPASTTGSNQIAPNLRIPPPIIIPADPNSCQRSETILENEVISCFIVGGEKRLCLPQILNTVLTDFSLQQINSVCDELHIFCSRCTPEQLEVLKVTGILPASAPSCGLITKTDAERLCAALLFYANRTKMILGSTFSGSGVEFDDLDLKCDGLSIDIEKLGAGIPICHECFGSCSGTVYTDLYIEPTSRCIKCSECKMWLTPQRFVTHIHSSSENHTCHWGFDSYNWRAYIHLDEESKEYQLADVEQLEAELDSFKSRFDPTVIGLTSSCNNSPAANKRKLEQSNKIQTEKKDDYDKQTNNLNRGQLPEPLKKIKTEEMPTMKQSPLDLLSPHPYSYFPVSTNWTPDPSVFNYWYHHPYVTQPPVSGLASLQLPQPTVSISTNQQNHPQQQQSIPRVTVEHKSRSNEDDEPESNKVQEKHLFSNLDKLLRRNKINRDLRVQIFKEIENILEEVRSTGDVDIKPS
ncbi:ski-like protein [Tetranychus urticae]|uniref:ski-like protein n=1 Tax=Tetranychus urticae TaxID=32264 RepID=UPI00077BE1A4|nr:ski-like protein [Tetranychus urticae]